MTGFNVIQIQVSDSSDKIIRGIYEFDRDNGGVLVLPSGSSLPLSGTTGEVFLDTTNNTLYFRNQTNTAWIPISGAIPPAVIGNGDPAAQYVLVSLTGSLPNARLLSGSGGISVTDNGAGSTIIIKETTPFTSQSHASLRQLVHLADGGGPWESFTTGAMLDTGPQPFPTASVWRDPTSKKIVEKLITRNTQQFPTTIQWKAYDIDGITILATVTDTVTYSGAFEATRTRAIT